jgi:hypothetical protein
MPGFTYQARTAYDVEQRIGQDREGGKVPKADNETPCLTCRHQKWAHCQKHRKAEKASLLWVSNYANPRFRAPAMCKHYDPAAPFAVPRCSSTACIVADCACVSFGSPYRKPKKPKASTAKPPATRKRVAKPKTAQLDLLLSPEAATVGMNLKDAGEPERAQV